MASLTSWITLSQSDRAHSRCLLSEWTLRCLKDSGSAAPVPLPSLLPRDVQAVKLFRMTICVFLPSKANRAPAELAPFCSLP